MEIVFDDHLNIIHLYFLKQSRICCEMPETVSIYDDGNVPGPGLLHDDADPAQHALVPSQAWSQDHAMKSRKPLVYLLNTVFRI